MRVCLTAWQLQLNKVIIQNVLDNCQKNILETNFVYQEIGNVLVPFLKVEVRAVNLGGQAKLGSVPI
jgi:hypothetical protein